ncbi:MAG: ABC transporter permease subunit [Candidatus Berkelbacteria bacterium]|nr:ABC transporter permease subunit [Candidatus Berkelbacteria bacterium]
MIAIIKRALRDRFIPFISYSIGGIVLVWMYIALLPSVQQSQVQLQDVMKAMPEGLMKALGVSGVNLASLEALLAMKQYNMIWPLLMIFFIVSFAGGMIAGEVENRTIEIVLSSAKSRAKIFFSKYLSGIIYLILFVVATTLCAIPMAKLYGYEYAAPNYYTLMYLSLCFGLAVYGLSILFSSLFSSRGKVYGISGILFVAMYVLFILVSLKDSLKNLQYISFFYYYNINDALIHNKIDGLSVFVFLSIGLIASLLALIIFLDRDFAV